MPLGTPFSPSAPVGLHTLWPVGDESFRVLASRPPAVPAGCNGGLRGISSSDAPPADAAAAGGQPSRMRAAREVVTRSARLDAPPAAVWPWLVQMMRGGGIYGWPRLETPGCRSSDVLLDGLPPPRVGDRLGDVLVLAVVEPDRRLVWRSQGPVRVGRLVVDELGLAYELDAAGAGSILTARTSVGGVLTAPLRRYVLDLVDALLPAQQLARIKALVEARPGPARRAGDAPHQAAPLHPATAP